MIGRIETARLVLRPMERTDLHLLEALDADPEVMRHLTGRPSTPDDVAADLESTLGTRWLVFDGDGEFAGWVAAAPASDGAGTELGWRFRRESWGQGYASEAAGALVAAVLDAGADRVFAQTMAVNQRSRAVMERLGMTLARTFHLDFDDPLPGTEKGEVEYELTRDRHRS